MKKCQFYGIMDRDPLCKAPRTHRLIQDGRLVGEVCAKHEREMLRLYPEMSSLPIRTRPPCDDRTWGERLREANSGN